MIREELLRQFAGKPVTADIKELCLDIDALTWWPEEKSGSLVLCCHGERDEDDEDDWDVLFSEDEEEEPCFPEEALYHTGIEFTLSPEETIEDITLTAETEDTDPEDAWTEEDLYLAEKFFRLITQPPASH